MNKKQRMVFSLVLTFVFPVFLTLGLGLNELTGGINSLSIIPPLILLTVAVYFLSFKIWDNSEQEATEDVKTRNNRILTKSQRIIIALLISLVPTINFYLASGLNILIEENLSTLATPLRLVLMMPVTSIFLAVGVYFFSFLFWENT